MYIPLNNLKMWYVIYNTTNVEYNLGWNFRNESLCFVQFNLLVEELQESDV